MSLMHLLLHLRECTFRRCLYLPAFATMARAWPWVQRQADVQVALQAHNLLPTAPVSYSLS